MVNVFEPNADKCLKIFARACLATISETQANVVSRKVTQKCLRHRLIHCFSFFVDAVYAAFQQTGKAAASEMVCGTV